ncbi:PilN domain-containing protein [Catenovulum sp. SM1970]|uniref:PilN domain-containing protein n=1 Tax=Marinifaba aquimaris TaxID=2741323 RepID=UPI0015741D3F|nr:PilN domain-containing protein [Marinifaba aquimaris]NTS75856.1 PilN domain-containing protein [Marinifaba aquimaris]
MKSSVNFYVKDFHPKVDLLSPKWVLSAWGVSLALIIVLSSFASSSLDEAKRANDIVLAEFEDTSETTEALKAKAQEHVESPSLLQAVVDLKKEKSVKKRLLQVLDSKEQKDSLGYADLMFDLAEFNNPDIWLTQISYGQKEVSIQGAVKDAASLPVWLGQLKNSSYFQGKELTELRMSNSDDELYNLFELATGGQAEDEPLSDWFTVSKDKGNNNG